MKKESSTNLQKYSGDSRIDGKAELVKYIIIAKKLIKDDKDANKKILSIRLKIANLKK